MLGGLAITLAGCSGEPVQVDQRVPAETTVAATQAPQLKVGAEKLVLHDEAGKVQFGNQVAYGSQDSGVSDYWNNNGSTLLPPGAIPANEAARQRSRGHYRYELLYIGTPNTSVQFANEIHNAWLSIVDPTTEPGIVVFDAWSDATKKVYRVTCLGSSHFVTCTGGNNAVVYIV